MSGWFVLAAWGLGWLLAVRPSMRRTMLKMACSRCNLDWMCDCNPLGRKPERVVRGSKFERSGGDVAWSLWIAAWWPAWLLALAVRALARGVTRAVVGATPLTAPELERRLAEREQEIERLHKQIGTTPP